MPRFRVKSTGKVHEGIGNYLYKTMAYRCSIIVPAFFPAGFALYIPPLSAKHDITKHKCVWAVAVFGMRRSAQPKYRSILQAGCAMLWGNVSFCVSPVMWEF